MNLNVELKNEYKLININEDTNLDIIGDNDSNLVIMINEGNNININAVFNDGNINLILFNQSKNNIVVKENYTINGGNIRICHGYFSHYDADIDHHTRILKGDLSFETYGLIKSNVKLNQLLENVECNTNVDFTNSVVVLKDSQLSINAVGSILKHAYKSKSLQKTNCLTFGELKNVNIIPTLLISENDVMASHSCAIGTMDDLQRFYLASRGLNESQISELVTTGYVLPLTRVIESDEFTELVLQKVNELCFK